MFSAARLRATALRLLLASLALAPLAGLGGCGLVAMTGKAIATIPGDFNALGTHAAAARAMERNDVDAAIGLLAGTRYIGDRREVKGGPTWGQIYWRAATLVAQAHEAGRAIDDAALLSAYRILARGADLAESVRYLALARPLVARQYGEKSPQVLELALDDRAIMLEYFRAGGALNLRGTDLRVSLSGMLDAPGKRTSVPLAYDPALLAAFPLRLSPADRELLFELNRLSLLPRAQWHDPAALKRMMATEEYLWWLDGPRSSGHLYWQLSRAVNEMSTAPMICAARAAGFDVRPGINYGPEEITPPGCLSR